MITIDLTDRECSLILLALGVAEDNAWSNSIDDNQMLAEHAKKTASDLNSLKHWIGAVMREKSLEAAQ